MSIFDQIREKLGSNPTPGVERRPTPQDIPAEDRTLFAQVRNKVEDARNAGSRQAKEATWMTNTAYLLGYDGIQFDPSARQFRSANSGSATIRKPQISVNKILPTLQNRLSKLCKNPPKYDVRPNSSDNDDKDAARLGLQVLDDIWARQKLNKKRIELYQWMQQCGYSFVKASWDPTLGDDMIGADGSLEGKMGDVRLDVVSAFQVYVDPLATSMDDAQWLVHAKVRKLEYFRAQYPEKGFMVAEEQAWLMASQYELSIGQMNSNNGSMGPTQMQMKDAAIELTMYERPTSQYPKGRMIIGASGVILEQKDLPIGEIPFAKFDDIIVGGKFDSESIITHLRPIQDQYNRVIRKRAQWTNILLAGKYVAPKGHGLHAEALNDRSGEVVEYTPQPTAPNGGMPVPMPVPNIPQYAYAEEDKLNEMHYDIAGINEISRGQLPSAGMPAIGMQFLLEQDDTRIGVITEGNEYAWADVGRFVLKFVGTNYKLPRLLKIAGKNKEYNVRKFIGADLRRNYDVCVIRGSTVPGSKVLKRQEIINTYQMGFLGDPQDPKVREKTLGLLEYGDVAEMWQDFAADMAQIKRQMDVLETGEVPTVNEFDNHELHLQELNRFRKSDKFEKLSPEIKTNWISIMDLHINYLQNMIAPGVKDEKELADQAVKATEEEMQNVGSDDQGTEEAQAGQGDQAGGVPG